MKEINIARMIISKRHEKGITQDELASYMGVSKASVSKWETGQSYPDISLLPHLAAYFNVSIDELMDYSPQMTKEDIAKLYHRLANDFNKRPFDEVIDECHDIIKKYYSCFPLLLQMALLLLNHLSFTTEKEIQGEIIEEVSTLCVRAKSETDDIGLSQQANYLHAMCCLIQNKPAEVIDLLESWQYLFKIDDTTLLSNAYLGMGNVDKSKEILQVSSYTGILSVLTSSTSLLPLVADNNESSELIINRLTSLIELFDLKQLHVNSVLIFYLTASQNCLSRGQTDRALSFLEDYSELACRLEYPITLHGDDYFDHIDQWFDDFYLGNSSPTEEKTIRKSILDGVKQNPAFSALAENDRYKTVISKLESNIKG